MILLISHTANLHGGERSLVDLSLGLQRRKVPFIVMCPAEGVLPELLRANGIKVQIFFLPRPQRNIIQLLKFFILWIIVVWRLRNWMRQNTIDIVYNNTIDGLYGPFAAKLNQCPCVWHVREVKPQNKHIRFLFVLLLKNFATQVVFNSNATMQAYQLRPYPHWQVIYNGLDLTRCHMNLSEKRDNFLLLFVGQIEKHKRADRFLEIVVRTKKSYPNLKGLIVGDGEELEEMKQLSQRIHVQNDVEFTGYLHDVNRVYQQSDVFILTSDTEPFGRVIIEAMAHALPVVAANVGGVSEVVDENITGFLVEKDDIDAYVEKIRQLIADPKLCREMGLAGRKRVESFFSLDAYQNNLIAVLCDP